MPSDTKDYDDMQQDLTEIVKAFLRKELGKGYYHNNIQAVVITTNKVTGKVNIDSCNVNLVADVKKLLHEGFMQLERSQMANALSSIIQMKIEQILKRKPGWRAVGGGKSGGKRRKK